MGVRTEASPETRERLQRALDEIGADRPRQAQGAGTGARLREARTARGWTQAQLSQATGRSEQSILHWERDDNLPDARSLIDLALALQVSVDWLLGLSDSRTPARRITERGDQK
jgi:ribosome-binding protein aMBF1 (putative translation factor)